MDPQPHAAYPLSQNRLSIRANAGWLGAAQLLAKVLNLGIYASLTRRLGQEGFGLFIYSFSLMEILGFAATLGLPIIYTRHVAAGDLDSARAAVWAKHLGSLLVGLGAGYRPAEFEMFGKRLEDRWTYMEEICAFLRQAWTGEPFEWQGRRIHVTPRPEPAPPILLGGSSAASARRAARIADDWFPPLEPRLWTPYRDACLELGKPDPGPYPSHGPIFLWISRDPARAWDHLMPHVLHQLHSYAEWTVEAFGRAAGPYAKKMSAENVRDSDAYQVLTPEQALELADTLGDHSVFYLNPLLAGIDPKRSWEMLRLFEKEVRPYLPSPHSTPVD